jgi:catechol 2,3-dioxygenase-like lactoylglutathione lyase family enzyme
MSVKRMDHVGVVVEDLAAAVEFFVELGLEVLGQSAVEGDWVGRVIGLEDVRAEVAMLQTPDGHSRLELVRFDSPDAQDGSADAPSNALGIRHLTFAVENLDDVIARLEARGGELVGNVERYEDMYRLCYIRGPQGIIVELAEELS